MHIMLPGFFSQDHCLASSFGFSLSSSVLLTQHHCAHILHCVSHNLLCFPCGYFSFLSLFSCSSLLQGPTPWPLNSRISWHPYKAFLSPNPRPPGFCVEHTCPNTRALSYGQVCEYEGCALLHSHSLSISSKTWTLGWSRCPKSRPKSWNTKTQGKL